MDIREVDFHELIKEYPSGIVSLTGGGGKTSLLFALGKALSASGQRILCTTTTRMLRPDPSEWLTVDLEENPAKLRPPSTNAWFAARPPATGIDPAKARGYPPEAVDAMLDRKLADWILVEADGAAGRPVKAPAAHEPVVPSRTGIAIAVMGLAGIDKPLSGATAFRLAEVQAVTGIRIGETLTPAAAARLVDHPQGMFKSTPEKAKRILFCNQADLPGAEVAGYAFAEAVVRRCSGFLDGLYIGSLPRKGLGCQSCPTTK